MMTISAGAYSTIRVNRSVRTTASSAAGARPRPSSVPPPRKPSRSRSRAVAVITSAHSSNVAGAYTTPGRLPRISSRSLTSHFIAAPRGCEPAQRDQEPAPRGREPAPRGWEGLWPGRRRPGSRASSSPREAGGLRRVRVVLAGAIAAQPRRREHLARVHPHLGIERAAHEVHRREIRVGEHLAHVRRLVGADPVLTGDRAAALHAQLQDLAGGVLGELLLARD